MTWAEPPPFSLLSIDTAGYNTDPIQFNSCLGSLWVMVVCLKIFIGVWGDSSFGKVLAVEV